MELIINAQGTSPCLIKINGEMTVSNAIYAKEHIIPFVESADKIFIDTCDVTEIDSAGMQLLILAKYIATQTNKSLYFKNTNNSIVELIRLFRLEEFFNHPNAGEEESNDEL